MENAPLAQSLSGTTERLVAWIRDTPTAEPLSPSAASLLVRLRSDGPMRIADLTRTQNISQPAVTQLVTRLNEEGLVQREASPTDRRSTVIHITDAGRRAVDERRERRAARIAEHLSSLTPQQREALEQALPALEALITSSVKEESK